jgi:hypothetical protein
MPFVDRQSTGASWDCEVGLAMSGAAASQKSWWRQSTGVADPESFVALYEGEAELVLIFLARRTLDVEVALDLAAETFAQAWQGWSKVRLDSPEEVRGWLFTIARRQLGRY